MKSLDAQESAIFKVLIEGLKNPGDAKKIDNTDGTFMPVHVDYLDQSAYGCIYAVAHHYIQNGDVMQDPDMTFLINNQGVFPLTFQQDNVALYQEAAGVENGQLILYDSKIQADLASFANDWMKNILEQQDIKLDSISYPHPPNGEPGLFQP